MSDDGFIVVKNWFSADHKYNIIIIRTDGSNIEKYYLAIVKVDFNQFIYKSTLVHVKLWSKNDEHFDDVRSVVGVIVGARPSEIVMCILFGDRQTSAMISAPDFFWHAYIVKWSLKWGGWPFLFTFFIHIFLPLRKRYLRVLIHLIIERRVLYFTPKNTFNTFYSLNKKGWKSQKNRAMILQNKNILGL